MWHHYLSPSRELLKPWCNLANTSAFHVVAACRITFLFWAVFCSIAGGSSSEMKLFPCICKIVCVETDDCSITSRCSPHACVVSIVFPIGTLSLSYNTLSLMVPPEGIAMSSVLVAGASYNKDTVIPSVDQVQPLLERAF
jgi:hypothetical protein